MVTDRKTIDIECDGCSIPQSMALVAAVDCQAEIEWPVSQRVPDDSMTCGAGDVLDICGAVDCGARKHECYLVLPEFEVVLVGRVIKVSPELVNQISVVESLPIVPKNNVRVVRTRSNAISSKGRSIAEGQEAIAFVTIVVGWHELGGIVLVREIENRMSRVPYVQGGSIRLVSNIGKSKPCPKMMGWIHVHIICRHDELASGVNVIDNRIHCIVHIEIWIVNYDQDPSPHAQGHVEVRACKCQQERNLEVIQRICDRCSVIVRARGLIGVEKHRRSSRTEPVDDVY